MRPITAPIPAANARPGFTLVELLVVIVIITVVISLVIPAVGKVRRTAKVANSQQIANQVANAASTFQQDKRKLPGYYSTRDMGLNENGKTIGMSAMLNALLDLSGGVVGVGGIKPVGGGPVQRVAPFSPTGSNASTVAWVDPTLIGSTGSGNTTSKGYFIPDKKYFYSPRLNVGTEVARFGMIDNSIPDLVDAFGTPLLLWSADESMNSPVAFDSGNSGANNFARIKSSSPAMFYWNTNAAYLNATSLGKSRTDQTKITKSGEGSLLGGGRTDLEREQTLAGLLGNPGFHTGDVAAGADAILPSAPRGKFIVQVANPDGFYLQPKDGVSVLDNTKILKFGYNFVLPGGAVRKDDKGAPTSVDITKSFGDILAVGGS